VAENNYIVRSANALYQSERFLPRRTPEPIPDPVYPVSMNEDAQTLRRVRDGLAAWGGTNDVNRV
jgi:hypothetical protein